VITIGYSALGISLPIFVAHKQGLFADQGVRVQLRGYPTAHPLVEAVIDDDSLACGGFVAFPISMHRHVRGRHLHFACAVAEDSSNPISFLLAREGSGVRSIEDLAGRRVGVLPTKAYREWFKLLCQRRGMGYHQVSIDKTCSCMETCAALDVPKDRIVSAHDVLPKDTVAALRSGRVDAIFTNDPGATAAVRAGVAYVLGDRPLLPAEIIDPFLFGSFVFDAKFVTAQPAAARAVVRAIDEAIRFTRAEEPRARAMAASYLPPDCAELEQGMGKPVYLTSNEVDAAQLQRTVDLFAREKVLGGTLDVSEWLLTGDAPAHAARRREPSAAAAPVI
jgi:ABC-type nitrate/sulfonate/bicarbonate transport system substrate-binding protein